jgi:hypothetical protein
MSQVCATPRRLPIVFPSSPIPRRDRALRARYWAERQWLVLRTVIPSSPLDFREGARAPTEFHYGRGTHAASGTSIPVPRMALSFMVFLRRRPNGGIHCQECPCDSRRYRFLIVVRRESIGQQSRPSHIVKLSEYVRLRSRCQVYGTFLGSCTEHKMLKPVDHEYFRSTGAACRWRESRVRLAGPENLGQQR